MGGGASVRRAGRNSADSDTSRWKDFSQPASQDALGFWSRRYGSVSTRNGVSGCLTIDTMFNTVADLLCVLLHSLHMGKYVAIQGNRSPCCVMRFIVVSFVHVPTAAKRHACRLDVGWTIVCLLQQKGMRRTVRLSRSQTHSAPPTECPPWKWVWVGD